MTWRKKKKFQLKRKLKINNPNKKPRKRLKNPPKNNLKQKNPKPNEEFYERINILLNDV